MNGKFLHRTLRINTGALIRQVGGKWFWPLPSVCGVFGTFERCFGREVRTSVSSHWKLWITTSSALLEFPWSVFSPKWRLATSIKVSGHLYKNACKWFMHCNWQQKVVQVLVLMEVDVGWPKRKWLKGKARVPKDSDEHVNSFWVWVSHDYLIFQQEFPKLDHLLIANREGKKTWQWSSWFWKQPAYSLQQREWSFSRAGSSCFPIDQNVTGQWLQMQM